MGCLKLVDKFHSIQFGYNMRSSIPWMREVEISDDEAESSLCYGGNASLHVQLRPTLIVSIVDVVEGHTSWQLRFKIQRC